MRFILVPPSSRRRLEKTLYVPTFWDLVRACRRSRFTRDAQNWVVNCVFEMESGLRLRASIKVFCSCGSSRMIACCKATSALSFSSSSQIFRDPLPPPETAAAIARAADEPAAAPSAAFWAAFCAWMTFDNASLTAFASSLALLAEVKLKMCATGSVFPGSCANIFSITFALDSGVCCKFVMLAAEMTKTGAASGG